MKSFCSAVQAAGYAYAWCDTCCIDKSSSSELSESINSMFRWYQNAAVTYVYLSDVHTTLIEGTDSEFGKSEWWSRGWCLQELLAPLEVNFFNCDWKLLGTKEELGDLLVGITRIPYNALFSKDYQHYSIAQRMSWASERKVTRVEDTAYCLLGLFQVNMPLLYGEGDRAFTRLQEEIMKQSSDHSLFVHTPKGQFVHPNERSLRLLAESPRDFLLSEDIVSSDTSRRKPFGLTNMGLSIKLLLYQWSLDIYMAVLDCHRASFPDDNVVIYLSLPSIPPNETLLAPVESAFRIAVKDEPWTTLSQILTLPGIWKKLYIRLHLPQLSRTLRIPSRRYGFWVKKVLCENEWKVNERLWAVSWDKWDPERRLLELPDGKWGTVGIVVWESDPVGNRAYEMVLRLGFTLDFRPVIQFSDSMEIWQDRGGCPPVVMDSPGVFSGGNEYFKTQPAQSQAEMVLSVTRWMEDSDSRTDGRFLFKGRDRNSPIKEKRGWGHQLGKRENARTGLLEISCEKEVMEGFETWVLEVTWRQGTWHLPPKHLQVQYTMCKGCNKVSSNLADVKNRLIHAQYISENLVQCESCEDCSFALNARI